MAQPDARLLQWAMQQKEDLQCVILASKDKDSTFNWKIARKGSQGSGRPARLRKSNVGLNLDRRQRNRRQWDTQQRRLKDLKE